MRLPNGFGSCIDLGKGRRKRYAARVTIGWENDKQVYKYIGYYKTRSECLRALSLYSHNYDLIESFTFSEIFEMWSEKKFPTLSEGAKNNYMSAYRQAEILYDKPFDKIKTSDYQRCIDSMRSDTAKRKLKIIISSLYDYAIKSELIEPQDNLAAYIEIPAETKSNRHNRFSKEEMDILWKNSDNPNVQLILILIYTGVRPSELFSLRKDDMHDKYFRITKGKTKNAARDVPIHDSIKTFFESWDNPDCEYVISDRERPCYTYIGMYPYRYFTDSVFIPTLESLGILVYNNGIEHTVYDTRSTFTTKWMEQNLNEAMRRKIQGHSGKGVGEEYYAHFSIDALYDEINRLI